MLMSKERLEEIKNIHEKFLDLDKKERYQEADDVLLYLREKHMNWLIEQAEDKLVWKKQAESFNEWFSKAKDESERYREAIEKIKSRIPIKYEKEIELSAALIGIADEIEHLYKALEGEE